MLTRFQTMKDEREAGFTLIELLVVVAIIGILAAIAIPVFLNQRNSAREASLKSDVNTVAQSLETYYTSANGWTGMPGAAGSDINVGLNGATQVIPVSAGNLVVTTMASPGQYVIVACNQDSNTQITYDAVNGGIQDGGVPAAYTGTCTGAANAQWG
jgi:type IV pilus assembly protein PilA